MPEETRFTENEQNAIDAELSKMVTANDRAHGAELRIEMVGENITDETINGHINWMQNALDDVANGAAECREGIKEFAENGEVKFRTSNVIDVSIAKDDDGKFTVTFDNSPDSTPSPRTMISTDDIKEALEVFESGFIRMEDMDATLNGSFAEVYIGRNTGFTDDERAAIREEAGKAAEVVDISSSQASRIWVGSEEIADSGDKIKLQEVAGTLDETARGALEFRAGLGAFAEKGEAVANNQYGEEVSISRDDNGMYTVEVDQGMGPETVIETDDINEALSEYEKCFVNEDDVDAVLSGVYSFVDPDTIDEILEVYEDTQKTEDTVEETITVGDETFTSIDGTGDLEELADALENQDVGFAEFEGLADVPEDVEAGSIDAESTDNTDISKRDDMSDVDTENNTGSVDNDGSDPVD